MSASGKTGLLLLSFLLFGALLSLPVEPPRNSQPADSQAIKVQVDMVSLPVVVTDREGKRIMDLQKEDFQVFEDKTPQQIAGFTATDEPITVALALDTSGSMKERLARVQNEAIRFVNMLHPDDSLAVLSFADDANLLEDFSIDRIRNARGIKETRVGDGTKLFEAVWLSLVEVLKPIKERNALVLFSDGVDTSSRLASMKETLDLAKETRATIYCIYFNTQGDMARAQGTSGRLGGIWLPLPPVIGNPAPPGRGTSSADYEEGRRYLSELAEYSGGVVFDALTLQDLGPAFESIARELASQYSIGYYSTNTKRDGKFRKVEVRVRRPNLVARSKKGYYAPKEAKK